MDPRPDPTFLPTKLREIQARLSEVDGELAEHQERVAALEWEKLPLVEAVKALERIT